MQENADLNVTRLERKDKTEELEKANTKLLENTRYMKLKTYLNREVVYYLSVNYPIHSNPSRNFLVKRKIT